MEFGSKFVYFYGDSDEESVSDDEYCAGITDDRYMLQLGPCCIFSCCVS